MLTNEFYADRTTDRYCIICGADCTPAMLADDPEDRVVYSRVGGDSANGYQASHGLCLDSAADTDRVMLELRERLGLN